MLFHYVAYLIQPNLTIQIVQNSIICVIFLKNLHQTTCCILRTFLSPFPDPTVNKPRPIMQLSQRFNAQVNTKVEIYAKTGFSIKTRPINNKGSD